MSPVFETDPSPLSLMGSPLVGLNIAVAAFILCPQMVFSLPLFFNFFPCLSCLQCFKDYLLFLRIIIESNYFVPLLIR